MLSSRQFGEYRLSVVGQPPYISADHEQHGNVGTMELSGPDPETGDRAIGMVEVRPEHRRRGLATAMYDLASDAGLRPVMSGERTVLGDEFEKSLVAKRGAAHVPLLERFDWEDR